MKASRVEFVLGLLPFVIFGAAAVVMESPFPGPIDVNQVPFLLKLGAWLFFGGYVVILFVLFAGVLLEFPRWSMPYLVYGVLFAVYLMNASTPGLVIFGFPMWGRELWGWRSLVPVGTVLLLGLLLSRPPWQPLVQLVKNIWRDWTTLAFGLYGLMPMIGLIIQDEMDNAYTMGITLLCALIVLAGAVLYLRYGDRPYRALFLLGSVFVSILISTLNANWYWGTHDVDFSTGVRTALPGPAPWGKIITEALTTAGSVTLFFTACGVVGLLYYLTHRKGGSYER